MTLKQIDSKLKQKSKQYIIRIRQINKQLRLERAERKRLEAKLKETQEEHRVLKIEFDRLLKEKIDEHSFELQLFYDLSRKIGYNLSYEELFQSMLDHLHLIVPCDITGGIIIEEQKCNLFLRTARALSTAAGAEIQKQLFASLAKVNGSDIERHPLCLHYLNWEPISSTKPPIEQIGSHFLVPIIANPDKEREIIGLLFVGAENKEQFAKKDIHRLYALANQASISVQQLRVSIAAEQNRQETEKIRASLEKEKELNNLKSRVIRTISHEYRTPITIISLASELLRTQYSKLSDRQRMTCWQQIQNATAHMANLVEDVLTLNLVEAGEIQIHPVPLDLKAFCRQVVGEFQLIAHPGQSIQFSYRGTEVEAYLDKKLLRQILGNLLSNALKYSPTDGVVSFELICYPDRAIFQVGDRGIGIPSEDRDKLFESFYRASNITNNFPGSGLGLAIVKKCVDLQGGEISFETEVGVGTTFTVEIPFLDRAFMEP